MCAEHEPDIYSTEYTKAAPGVFDELTLCLSSGALSLDPDVIASYSKDHATFCPAGRASALIRARCIDDVQESMRFAHQRGLPVVVQGARTGLSGAANAVDACILLNLSTMDRIVTTDLTERTCTVEPGVINKDLKDHLAAFSLAYPPDPGSVAISTIGGNVATNAGGMCCLKYGVTRDYVRGLTIVLADGELIEVGRNTAKNSAGFDLAQLLIGSEGTLGVIVEITLDLVPALPPVLSGMASFGTTAEALVTVTEFLESGAQPTTLEFMDTTTMAILNDYADFGLDEETGVVLIVQSDGSGSSEQAEAELDEFTRIAQNNGSPLAGYSRDPEDSDMLLASRRAVNPAYENYAAKYGGGLLVDDVCVPRARLGNLFAFIDEVRATSELITIGTCAHIGDGNTHPTIVFDPADTRSRTQAENAFAAIMAEGIRLDGSISGEHGIGILKREWLSRELCGRAQALSSGIKSVFDPAGILNPGKQL